MELFLQNTGRRVPGLDFLCSLQLLVGFPREFWCVRAWAGCSRIHHHLLLACVQVSCGSWWELSSKGCTEQLLHHQQQIQGCSESPQNAALLVCTWENPGAGCFHLLGIVQSSTIKLKTKPLHICCTHCVKRRDNHI